MRNRICLLGLFLGLVLMPALLNAQSREEKVRQDRKKVEQEGFWIYNNLPKGFAEAKRTGKPIVVVLRCIPCVECVKLDDELVDRDPVIRPLLEKFVCVRVVSTNGLNLTTFQYDTDQSFAVFMLNADGTVYGRFGTRSHHSEWLEDVSLKGMAAALEGALKLHQQYPKNKKGLTGKQGKPLEFLSPEKYPLLKKKFKATLDVKGDVVKSCIHCHQIGDARRAFYWQNRKPIPESIFFPYPHPKSIGLILNPDTKAEIKQIISGSIADEAGLKKGDQIRFLSEQPILSMADIQWGLDQASPDGASVSVLVDRAGKTSLRLLKLPAGWRRNGDLDWRVSSWGYRRMFTGGMKLVELSEEKKAALKINADKMALLVEHLGRYGPHAAAKKAGAKKGDILTSYNGQSKKMTESELFFYANTHNNIGEKIDLTVKRNGKTISMKLPIQK